MTQLYTMEQLRLLAWLDFEFWCERKQLESKDFRYKSEQEKIGLFKDYCQANDEDKACHAPAP
jgi:hypothetical protein